MVSRIADSWLASLLLAALVTLHGATARAAPAIELEARGPHDAKGALEVLEDPTATLSLPQVLAHPGFEPMASAGLNLGFTNSAYWFRTRVHNAGGKRDFLVEFAYPHLELATCRRIWCDEPPADDCAFLAVGRERADKNGQPEPAKLSG